MAHFHTKFPVDSSVQPDAFISLISKWVAGMPHSSLNTAEISGESVSDEQRIENNKESLHICRIASEVGGSVAGRYELNEENGRRWITEVVISIIDGRPVLSTKVLCDSINPEEKLPTPFMPYILKMVLKNGWGGDDGGMTVSNSPLLLKNDEVDFASSIMCGVSRNTLPIVYVSACFGGEGHNVDFKRLAKKLGGLAHVVVEPNRAFSNRLAISTHKQNAYGGAIGVYWPDGAARKIYRIGDRIRSSSDLEKIVYADIVNTLANQRGEPRCSWQFTREQMAVRRLQALRDKNSQDYTEYCAAFDAENESLRAQLLEANREIFLLSAERKKKNVDDEKNFIKIYTGSEQDYFCNEIISTIIWFLQKGRHSAIEGSRKLHILNAILDANQCANDGEEISKEIKKILSDDKRIDAKIKRDLNAIGFDIAEEGKHYKMVYMGDARYTFSLSKTPSDHRSGKNLASDICKMIL